MTTRLHSGSSVALSSKGFTLVEIVLAVGITAVALVGVLILFTAGLRTTRTGTDDTQMAEVGQDFIAYYQQLALSSNNYVNTRVLADATYSTVATNDGIRYSVHVGVTNAGFPQMTMLSSTSSNLLSRVTIEVCRSGVKTNTYITEVARYVMP